MALPQNFAVIWKKYADQIAGLDADDPDDRRQLRAINGARARELIAAGMTEEEFYRPTPDQQRAMNQALGASGAVKPFGLMDNSQAQPGELAGVVDGKEVWINNQTRSTRPRGLIDQATGQPFVPPKDAAAAGKVPGVTATGGTSTTAGGTTGTTGGTSSGGTVGTSGKTLPISRGQYDDFSAQARTVMSRLGITSREANDAEIVQFADAGLNADGIVKFYSNLKEFVDQQPGLPYGLSKQDYETQRTQMEKDTAALEDTTPSGTAAGTEPGFVSEALKEKMSSGELQAGLKDQAKRLGAKQPTAADVSSIRTRPTMTTEEDRAGAATTRTGLGPTQDLGGAAAVSPFGRRR